ncbi:MAG TPA: response regulator transcription factor [Steroidobacteraceae bacterium]|nr:response regulator transcription factor [Steroidobacteraceae bacterium]
MSAARERIRVLIAEDNGDLAAAVCELLQTEPDIEVVGVIDDAAALERSVRDLDVHVVILDLNLSGGSSVPAMQSVRHDRPGTGVVVYSGYDRADISAALPALGACEFVSKSGEVSALIDAVRRSARKTAAGADR